MLQNLPNRATKDRVQAHLNELGVTVEDVQLPFIRSRNVNRGYAFVQFLTEAEAKRFIVQVEGTQLKGFQSAKLLTALFSTSPSGKAGKDKIEKPSLARGSKQPADGSGAKDKPVKPVAAAGADE